MATGKTSSQPTVHSCRKIKSGRPLARTRGRGCAPIAYPALSVASRPSCWAKFGAPYGSEGRG